MHWIVFGEDWGSHPSSTQHLFKQICQQDNVTWVNSLGLRSPRLSRHDIVRASKKLSAMFGQNGENDSYQTQTPLQLETKRQAQTAPDHTPYIQGHHAAPQQIIQPQTLPLFGSNTARRFNRYQLSKQLRHLLIDADHHPKASEQSPEGHTSANYRVLWLSLPSALDMVGLCGEDLCVYYCGDDFSSLAGVDHQVISQMEAELVERCDLILTASHELASKFPAKKTQVLEHGVDYPLFSLPQPKPTDFPTGKVMGFYGQLADWVDIKLLEQIADLFPDWTLMLIGAIHTDTGQLLKRKNVIQLDAMPHHQLAAYCQHWQIALLPFKPCEQITHCNPLKLREYLATGTPVMSLRFPAAEQYSSTVTLADDREEFVRQLDLLISRIQCFSASQRQHLREQQQSLVVTDSWQHKTELARSWIEQKLYCQFNSALTSQEITQTTQSTGPANPF